MHCINGQASDSISSTIVSSVICSLKTTVMDTKLTILRLKVILATTNYSFLHFLLLILYKLMKLVNKQGQFSAFIVNFDLQYIIDTFAAVGIKGFW